MFKATVKSTGYPMLPETTLSGNLVQNLKASDAAGNRVLTFDSVEDGDTLLLFRKGKYALETGVDINPIGAEYSKALSVKENKKTGIRKLNIKKEAPVKLTKDGVSKIILINLVSVKKKSVTLKPNKSCTLADLFGEAYELLPDTKGEDTNAFEINTIDKKGAVFIHDASFPAAAGSGVTTLSDFTIKHSGRPGSVTVQVNFGGKVIKAKIKCK